MIKAWWAVHCESFFAQSYIRRPQPAMVMANAPDSLSLHYAQCLIDILDLEDQLCAYHRVMAATVDEFAHGRS
jgi:hypothetical protein